MKCERCGAASDVLETRAAEHGMVKRRRQCGNGHRFKTFEVYEPTAKAVERDIRGTWRRVQAAAQRWWRDRKIILDPRGASEVARAVQLTEARVRQIRASARVTHPGVGPSDNSQAGSSGAKPQKGTDK